MRCYECGGTYKQHVGSLMLHNKFIGDYKLHNVEYYKCDDCKSLLFPKKTTIKIEKKEQECRDSLIKQLPIEDFVFASEAAKLLNISRQALHKHIRIRRGFIYWITFGGKRVYHKKSILLFKEQGDGRFPLTPEVSIDNVERQYIVMAQLPKQKVADYVGIPSILDTLTSYKPFETKLEPSFN